MNKLETKIDVTNESEEYTDVSVYIEKYEGEWCFGVTRDRSTGEVTRGTVLFAERHEEEDDEDRPDFEEADYIPADVQQAFEDAMPAVLKAMEV